MDYPQRIARIREYRELGTRLLDFIPEEQEGKRKCLNLLLKDLEDLTLGYGFKVKITRHEAREEERDKSLRESAITRMLPLYGYDREKAEKRYDSVKARTPVKNAVISFFKGHINAVAATILMPIPALRKDALLFLRAASDYIEASRSYLRFAELERELRRKIVEKNREAARAAGNLEYEQARGVTALENMGLSEDAATKLIETPEAIAIGFIDSLKEEYAPWL